MGLSLSLVTYSLILFKDPGPIKLIWTLIVFAGIALQWVTEPLMIRLSFLLYIRQHETNLFDVNQILMTKPGNATWVYDSTLWKRNGISETEGRTINDLVNSKHISLIVKDSTKIYFRTFGMLDVSHGLYYFYSSQKPESRYRHVIGNWYY